MQKMPEKVFYPTQSLSHATEAILTLLNDICDAQGRRVPYPKYVDRQYINDMLGSIVNNLIGIGIKEGLKPDAKRINHDFLSQINKQ